MDDPVGALAVGLVDDEDVGDLHQARLDRLDVVPHAGRQHHDATLGEAEDLDLVLADADRLDEDLVEAGGVEDVHGVGRRAGQAAEVSPGGHRADEDARDRCRSSCIRIRSPRIAPPRTGTKGRRRRCRPSSPRPGPAWRTRR